MNTEEPHHNGHKRVEKLTIADFAQCPSHLFLLISIFGLTDLDWIEKPMDRRADRWMDTLSYGVVAHD